MTQIYNQYLTLKEEYELLDWCLHKNARLSSEWNILGISIDGKRLFPRAYGTFETRCVVKIKGNSGNYISNVSYYLITINPVTKYVMFRASSMVLIKAWLAAIGDFLGKSHNAD
jgi:hypothetical protein